MSGMSESYTPAFKAFKDLCNQNYKLTQFQAPAFEAKLQNLKFGAEEIEATSEILDKIDNCNHHELTYIKEVFTETKLAFDKWLITLRVEQKKDKETEIANYQKFFENVNKKLNEGLKQGENNPNNGRKISSSSYVTPSLQGQSVYADMMHALGYDMIVIGSGAMFLMAFSALRLVCHTKLLEQISEYYSADPSMRFVSDQLTHEQKRMQLHKDSTHAEIIEAGFLPFPNLFDAYGLEFESFHQKMSSTGQHQQDKPNARVAQLRAS